MRELKGCLQPIINIRLVKGTSPRFGFVAHMTLKCGHVIQRFGGERRSKRSNCIICFKQNENK